MTCSPSPRSHSTGRGDRPDRRAGRNASVCDLPPPRLAAAARHGELPADGVILRAPLLRAEGNRQSCWSA